MQGVPAEGAEHASGEGHHGDPAARDRQGIVDAVHGVRRVRVEALHAVLAQPVGCLDARGGLGEFAEDEAPHGRAPSSSLIPPP